MSTQSVPELSGVLNFYKPAGMTSQQAVSRAKRLCGAKKCGHTGTLDPMAEGVLPLLFGKATCLSDLVMAGDKTYLAGCRLGIVTDTQDTTGTVLETKPVSVTTECLRAACAAFVGEIDQVPPMYSAISVQGKRLYEYARDGVEIERESRRVTIKSISVVSGEGADFLLRVHCGKGTYIRTLLHDIGQKLGCGAAMSSLVRERTGRFTAGQAVTLEQLERGFDPGTLLTGEELFSELPAVSVDGFFTRLLDSGLRVQLKKLRAQLAQGALCRLYGTDGYMGIAQAVIWEGEPCLYLFKRF